uniref:Uncharacterized protein n=1 Tax=Opuntia streptacantha TaxID=393608 RepID=A0A7C9AHT4_OPUST
MMYSLAGLDFCSLIRRQSIPLGLPSTNRSWSIGLCQTISMGYCKTELFHFEEHLRRRGSATYHYCYLAWKRTHVTSWCIYDHIQHRGCTTHVSNFVLSNTTEYSLCNNISNANICAPLSSHCPWKAPTIAMEHRESPQIDRQCRHFIC